MTTHIYGIPNCDTVRKARKWMEGLGYDYTFHDYKKEGVDADRLARWADEEGWEKLLNRRGTTFRKLDEAQRSDIDRTRALALMEEHPSLIKRPVVEHDDGILVGFDEQRWSTALG